MEIYLIRHTTPDIYKGLIYGRLDVPLSESFGAEKESVIVKLPEHIDLVISSPSSRCILLAREIAEFYVKDNRLMELDFGLWEGKTWDTIDRKESEMWMSNFINTAPPQGESLGKMNERVVDFWNQLLKLPYKKIAIVTHAGVIRLILAAVNSIPLQSVFDIKVQYGEVITLNFPSHI
ncbi:alpha-ribazole phosphatase [Mucilaginibacter aquaedulcis]|uniref:alpha-ribazole phosphatase n=1 Tax=Mucilaginibacter aquaedulcis TaxID=1187081 RepID=UPI0025B37926|nr:alpha-ribazole phosphatase [Mucilaginibacter aquaedulcis]MDN3548203.1 alpha-ribazole phosphatase [Mucilaginibacter aquaedulcis]